LAAAVVTHPGTAQSQELRIRVTEPGRPNYAVGSLVSLLTPDGAVAAAGITNDFGRVRLRAPAGRYQARIERPGFRDTTIAVTVPATLDSVTVAHAATRPTLPTRLVPPTEPCVQASVSETAGPLLVEARRMLAVVAATEEHAVVNQSIARFERQLSSSLKKDAEEYNTVVVTANRPARALDPANLPGGYLERSPAPAWQAPTVSVFLAPAFEASHCFGLVNGTESRLGMIGLRFVPTAGDRVDLEGTMWFDQVTRELKVLDYRYTGVPRDWRPDRFGGTLEFHRADPGFWITRFWYDRVPRLEVSGSRERLRGYLELGGEVMTITPAIDTTDRVITTLALAQQQAIGQAQVAKVSGTVVDTLGYPVRDAEVFVMGTEFRAQSDTAGRFTMAGLPLGGQIVQVRKVGYKPQYFVIRLAGGQEWDGRVAIEKLPQTLGEIVVVGKWGKPAQYANTSKYDDFYRRRANGQGRFMTREEIDKQAAGKISDLLKAVPGIRVAFTAPGQTEDIAFLTCPGYNVSVWIDGQKMTGDVTEILPLITPSDVETMEVYQRQSAIPPEFRDNSCAAIVLWTR
ncbi:MAG: carboxypeptidase regulatory-like domain-containing protein, partial [Gemmatimonadales bacterium]